MKRSPAVYGRPTIGTTFLGIMLAVGASCAWAAQERPANRLASETSPYLRLHAHNPVDWYPWGPEALEKAKTENKPIFLSIGYSSCFWCHVMERKVFENEDIATYMNEHFVCIKVDREERPDLDDLYMLALQIYLQATGSGQGGGWPLSIFLTPDAKPIAGGTYFPPEDAPGRPGFPSVLKQVHNLWISQEPKIRDTSEILAKEVRRLAAPQAKPATEQFSPATVRRAIEGLAASYDSEYGGFDFDPENPDSAKFPQPCKLLFLEANASAESGTVDVPKMLDATLTHMAEGGLYDHLGGGFHRYSTDRQWLVPHFEKMLYDNAQLAEVYALAARRTGREDYRRVAQGTINFVLRDLTDAQGGFYCALDAETDGVEGAYYIWSTTEVQKTLGPEAAKFFSAAYGLDKPSSFEHGYVLSRVKSAAELAAEFQIDAASVESQLAPLREQLLKVRDQRPALLRDDKVLTAWNGLMIRSLARCGKLLDQPEYLAAAEKSAMFVLSNMRNAEGNLQRAWCDGEVGHAACLDDYAFLIEGVLALHEATGDEKWLNAARRLMDSQIDRFWDDQNGGFFYTADDHEELLARLKDGYDSVMPSGNSTSADALLDLGQRTEEPKYRDLANQTFAAFAGPMDQSPSGYVRMVQAASRTLGAVAEETPAPMAPDKELAAGPGSKTTSASRKKLQPAAELTAEEAAKHPQVSGKVYLSQDRLVPGQTCRVALVADIAKSWHLNANPAKPDYVVPVELELTSAAGVELTDVVYPAGHDFMLEGIDEAVSVYEGQVVIYGTLKVPEGVAATSEELQFSMRYQACNDRECLRQMRLKLNGKAPVAKSVNQAKPINESLFEAKKRQDGEG